MDGVEDFEHASLTARFRVEREIGRGGMAVVYLADDLRHHRKVALKVLRPDLAETLAADRFRREIGVVASLTHPNILPLYDSADDNLGGPPFFVMPYVEGETLRGRMARGTLPVADAVQIAIDVARALDHAHRRGIVHRDIKPENILLVDERPVVADFGIAHAVREASGERLTQTGVILGTPAYMSPEQVSGDRDIDGRSDLFSLGCVLYEMVAGEAPFAAPTVGGTMSRIVTAEPRRLREGRPEVSDALSAAVSKSLAKEPAQRFQTGAEFAGALAAAQQGASAPATASRRPRWIASLAVIAGAIVAVGVIASRYRGATPTARDLPSIAVLPFTNESGDTADAYLGEGIADELLNALADVPGLRVASRTSSASLGSKPNLAEIGRRLGVTAVLEGTVQRSRGTIRVSARLVSSARDSTIWHDRFDRPAADVFEVQEGIARAIVGNLRVRLTANGQLVRRRTKNSEAYDLVLRARTLVNAGSSVEALHLLDRAIALDSTYAEAWAQLTIVYNALGIFREQDSVDDAAANPSEMLLRARKAAERAVELDSTSGEAHIALAVAAFRNDWDWDRASREARRAVELNPTSPTIYQYYSRIERSFKRFDHARALMDSVVLYSGPTPPPAIGFSRGRISYFAREYARGIEESLTPPVPPIESARAVWLAELFTATQQFAKAESLLTRPNRTDPGKLAALARVLVFTNRRDSARAVLTSIRTHPRNDLPTYIAGVYALMGDTAAALAELHRAVAVHDPLVVDFGVDPWLDPLRKNPEFVRIMSQLAFPSP